MPKNLPRALAIAAIAAALAVGAAPAAEPSALPDGEPLAVEASALVPVEAETSLEIVAITGQIVVESGQPRELKVVSRTAGANGADAPIGIWQSRQKLVLAPPPGQKAMDRNVYVAVPPNFKVVIDAKSTTVVVTGAEGGVDLRGADLVATVSDTRGSFDANLTGGKLIVGDAGDSTLKLRGTILEVGGTRGNVNVHATGGKLSFTRVDGAVEVVCEDSELIVEGPTGPVRATARKGSASVKGVGAGVELELSGTPLVLKEGKGEVTVTSDANIEFREMSASLHFDMYGGVLRGKGNQGILEVRTRNTEVNVESIALGMRIQGDGLKATIAGVAGELYVDASLSDVTVDRVGSADVKLDRGSLTIQRAEGAVQAKVVGADVHIIDGNGPVTLELDGGDADVSWASMSGDKDSRLTNRSGRVTLHLPVTGPCRVAAKSRYGRVDSDVPGVKVSDDLGEAQGPVNGGSRPLVLVDANGDIHLTYGSGAGEAN